MKVLQEILYCLVMDCSDDCCDGYAECVVENCCIAERAAVYSCYVLFRIEEECVLL